MRGFLFRDWLATGLLAAGIVVGGLALSEPARSQDVASKGDVSLPEKPVCGMAFSSVAVLPGWRVLEGDKLQAYLGTMFTRPPPGDALAYIRHGDKVALVLGRGGCVVARQVIPAKMHRNVVRKALGIVA